LNKLLIFEFLRTVFFKGEKKKKIIDFLSILPVNVLRRFQTA